jgi:hypothetical protein
VARILRRATSTAILLGERDDAGAVRAALDHERAGMVEAGDEEGGTSPAEQSGDLAANATQPDRDGAR